MDGRSDEQAGGQTGNWADIGLRMMMEEGWRDGRMMDKK